MSKSKSVSKKEFDEYKKKDVKDDKRLIKSALKKEKFCKFK